MNLKLTWHGDRHPWNTGMVCHSCPHTSPMVVMVSNISGSWGCAAWHSYSLRYVGTSSLHSKERVDSHYPRVRSLGPQVAKPLCGLSLCTVTMWLSLASALLLANTGLMHLVCCLVFVEATLGFYVVPTYINTQASSSCLFIMD